MTDLSRRSLLMALSAVSCAIPLATKAAEADPLSADLDKAGVKAIADSYAAAGHNRDAAAWISGGRIDVDALRRAVAQDYSHGRMFVHAGWRLSHSEGRLFSLLAQRA